MAKDAYYFPHDSNAKDDEKTLFIISKYGLAGYGLYWVFIEKMHQQTDGKLTCSLIDGLALNFNTDITLLKQFYNDAITINLFVTDGEKYWSERVLRNKQLRDEIREIKSLAGKKGMEKRWNNETNNNGVITDNNSVITKHNKGKERKGKEIKDIYGELSNVLLTKEEYQKLKDKFNGDTDNRINRLSTYLESTGKKYHSHYATILSWARKDESQPVEVEKVYSDKSQKW